MKPLKLDYVSDETTQLSSQAQSEYRRICGQLNWLVFQSRPDISFDICTVTLHFCRLEPPFELIIHSEASYANLEDGSSQSGTFIFLKGKNNLLAPILWQSRKIQRVARSTLATETLAFINGVDICVFIKHRLEEMLGKN